MYINEELSLIIRNEDEVIGAIINEDAWDEKYEAK